MRRFLRRAPRGSLAILGFHNLRPTFSDPLRSERFPRAFRRLCRRLKRRYRLMTITEGLRHVGDGGPPICCIIFDDGYRDVHDVAMPILRSEGLVATSYVIVDCLETERLPWYEELARIVCATDRDSLIVETATESLTRALPSRTDLVARMDVYWDLCRALKADFPTDLDERLADLAQALEVSSYRPGDMGLMMNPAQARAMVDAGFEVGCHSVSHPILPALDDDALAQEIVAGRTRLANLLDRPVTSFCYPNGDNDARCQKLAENGGYQGAVSMMCGANLAGELDRFRLRRIPMSERDGWIYPWHTLYRIHTTLVENP